MSILLCVDLMLGVFLILFCSFLASDVISYLFAQILQSLLLTFGSVSSFFNEPSFSTFSVETQPLTSCFFLLLLLHFHVHVCF